MSIDKLNVICKDVAFLIKRNYDIFSMRMWNSLWSGVTIVQAPNLGCSTIRQTILIFFRRIVALSLDRTPKRISFFFLHKTGSLSWSSYENFLGGRC